jgi:hypothetical protein
VRHAADSWAIIVASSVAFISAVVDVYVTDIDSACVTGIVGLIENDRLIEWRRTPAT